MALRAPDSAKYLHPLEWSRVHLVCLKERTIHLYRFAAIRTEPPVEALRPLRTSYDWIIVDCPPTLGLLTVNGLSAASDVLIPFLVMSLAALGVVRDGRASRDHEGERAHGGRGHQGTLHQDLLAASRRVSGGKGPERGRKVKRRR